ncbi:MAG: Spy/CpxP family protein refolding chaperone [Proteobacteria bacterium]|nr:Spy/CpxP family protein refolding chaperone [Pseudomonadota bacterium]
MKTKMLSIVFFAFSLAMGQALADTPSTDSQSSCGCGGHMKKMVETLKLDDSQQAKIKSIKEQMKASQQANREQMKSIRMQMNQLVQAPNVDEAKLDSLINQKKELMGQMMKARVMAKNQIFNLLNPQQKTQYQDMMKKWEDGSHKHCAMHH